MQTGLTRSDRRIFAIAGAVFALLIFATILTAPASEIAWSSIPSSYLYTPGGARAAFLLLLRVGIKMQRWEEPPFRLLASAPRTTLVLAEPTETPSRLERSALRRFVEQGGRLLFCGPNLPIFFPEVRLLSTPVPSSLDGLTSMSPTEQFRPVLESQTSQSIELRPQALWQEFDNSQAAVYGRPNNAVVTVWALGAGEIIWWASATPLTNAGLDRAGNLSLFLASVGAGSRTNVYWDEYFHGERGSLFAYIGRVQVLRWAALQFMLLALACILTFSRRSGPVIPLVKVSRLSPLEFVETLGGIYRKAKAAPVAVNVATRHLRLELTRKLGLPVAISDSDLAQAAAERLGWNREELQDVLDRARTASVGRSLSLGSALGLVQQLQRFTARLTGPAKRQPTLVQERR